MILRVTTSAAGLWTVSENDFVLSQRSSRDEALAVAELVAAAIGAAGGTSVLLTDPAASEAEARA